MQNQLLFIQQSPNPLAIKFVFRDIFLPKGFLSFQKWTHQEDWLKPFWDKDFLAQIYIAQNFITFLHTPLEKKLDSHVSPWEDKKHEIQELLQFIPDFLGEYKEKTLENFENEIQNWIDNTILKATWTDGGSFQVQSFQDGILFLKAYGSCFQCPYVGMTIFKGILEPIQKFFPKIQNIMMK